MMVEEISFGTWPDDRVLLLLAGAGVLIPVATLVEVLEIVLVTAGSLARCGRSGLGFYRIRSDAFNILTSTGRPWNIYIGDG